VQVLDLGAERVAVQLVGMEEVVLVVQRQGPEAPDRRQLLHDHQRFPV
jgi:hypothetical protein